MEKKFRILTIALIFSGALNVSLIAAFAFFSSKENQISIPIMRAKSDPKCQTTNSQIVSAMSRQTFRELVSFLTNRELVEEGYTKRDLAVAALVTFHHFNLEKAISGHPTQTRTLQLPDNQKMEVYPGLTEEQFEAIIRFAYQEKWPLTAKGLFALLQKGTCDESLEQAFFLTPEFYSLQTFFQKSGAPQESSTLLKLISEGAWDLLEKWTHEPVDFSLDKRRELLLAYLTLHAPTAAQILLQTDFAFAVKRLEDRGILEVLALLKKQTVEGTKFCIELLRSPRSDAIWQAAAMTLYSYAGELPTAPIDPKAVLARFAPEPVAITAQPAPVFVPAPAVSAEPARFHVVKDGESLWKISRQYKVKVEEIVKLNGLEKDSLFPGMTLKIPQGTGSEPPR